MPPYCETSDEGGCVHDHTPGTAASIDGEIVGRIGEPHSRDRRQAIECIAERDVTGMQGDARIERRIPAAARRGNDSILAGTLRVPREGEKENQRDDLVRAAKRRGVAHELSGTIPAAP